MTIKCMFDFQLGDCTSMFELKVTIKIILAKCTFRPKLTFVTEKQTCPKCLVS